MAVLIPIPLKKTNEVDLVKPLKNLISVYCSTADEPVQFDEALNEMNKLRMNSTWRTLDKHESSLDVMTRYYDQLNFLEIKCPSAELQIPFKWRDAFDKGSFFSSSASLSLSSLSYEKICILFNIAAMQSQIASSCGSDKLNDEGLKSAAKYFQLSSGIFEHLKTLVPAHIHEDPTPDLQSDTLSALQVLMLAQAQESIFHKASSDKMKSSIVAKIAAQCEELYADALKKMQKESLRVLWEKDWIPTIAGKQGGFHAISEYYQSLVCRDKKEVGEEIARLKHAQELMKSAEARGGLNFNMKDYVNKINHNYEESKKDNDFIYHARIPDVKQLQPIDKAVLAKSTPVPEKINPNSQDLFSVLLPVSVQQALQAFDVRKTEIVNAEINKLREQSLLLNGILASLNLPAALEDTTGHALPQSLKDKAQALRDKGGVEAIQKLIEELPSLLERNREILSVCQNTLREEEESDEQLRSQFKTQWTRTPSPKLNEPLKKNIEKYTEIINNAVTADSFVREKYQAHREKITLLCKPEEELLAEIPAGSPIAALSNSDCVQRLKVLMKEVETLRSEREAIESELKSAATDMKTKFLTALSQEGCVNEQSLSTETLGEVYGPLQKQVRESLEKQKQLTHEIQQDNAEFCKEKNTNQSATQRENLLSELAAAHDTYMELTNNLVEGMTFYNNLTHMLVIFQNKINDFCFARKTEKEELCKSLQQTIVNEAKQPAVSPPAHHVAASQQKPQRPPPPPRPTTVPTSDSSVPPYPVHQEAPVTQPNLPYPVYPAYPYPYAPIPTSYNTYGQPYVPAPFPAAPGYQGQPQYGHYQTYPPPSNYPYPNQQPPPNQWQ